MHDFSLLDFSPIVILDSTLESVPLEKRAAIAERERLKPRDKPPMAEIDGLVLKRPIGRVFEKEIYLSDPKLKEAEDRRVIAVGRPHEGNFHLYNYIIPETGRSFANRALTTGARARQMSLLALTLLITLALAFFSIGFFQRGIVIGLVWLTPAIVFLSVAKHLSEQYRADRMLADYAAACLDRPARV
jgi:hypothetical protein